MTVLAAISAGSVLSNKWLKRKVSNGPRVPVVMNPAATMLRKDAVSLIRSSLALMRHFPIIYQYVGGYGGPSQGATFARDEAKDRVGRRFQGIRRFRSGYCSLFERRAAFTGGRWRRPSTLMASRLLGYKPDIARVRRSSLAICRARCAQLLAERGHIFPRSTAASRAPVRSAQAIPLDQCSRPRMSQQCDHSDRG